MIEDIVCLEEDPCGGALEPGTATQPNVPGEEVIATPPVARLVAGEEREGRARRGRVRRCAARGEDTRGLESQRKAHPAPDHQGMADIDVAWARVHTQIERACRRVAAER